MDINANLARQLELTKILEAGPLMDRLGDYFDALNELLELHAAMDQWLSKGGLLPARWSKWREE